MLGALKGTWKGVLKISLLLAGTYLVAHWLASVRPAADYRALPLAGNHVAVRIVAELHLMFAAFVLDVPVREIVKDGDGEERATGNQQIARRSVDDRSTALT